MIELDDLPQPSQHPDLRNWAERLTVTLRQLREQLQNGIPEDLSLLVAAAAAAIADLQAEDVSLDSRLDALEAGGGSMPTGASGDKTFYLNDQTIDADYSIPAGQNAMTAGDVTISSGVTVTVPSGSTWTIV